MTGKHTMRRSRLAASGRGTRRSGPRRVRLAGRLDLIRYSDCLFTLVLEDGSKVQGIARELGAEALREGFGKHVVVTGLAEFRPSGRILRVDADLVEPATASDLKIFSVVPRPLLATPAPERSLEKKRGLSALLGEWPGEEPLDLLLTQLKSLEQDSGQKMGKNDVTIPASPGRRTWIANRCRASWRRSMGTTR